MELEKLGQRDLATGRIVAQVEDLEGGACAQCGAHDLDAVGQQPIVLKVELDQRLIRAQPTPKGADVSLEVSEDVMAEIEHGERRARREHARQAVRVLDLGAHAVVAQVELLDLLIVLTNEPERDQPNLGQLALLLRKVPIRTALGEARAEVARGDAARVVHERVVEELCSGQVRLPCLPARLGLEQEILCEEALLEGEVLELVLRGRELGLRLERLRERQPRVLLVQVHPQRQPFRIHLVDEQRRGDVDSRELAPAGELVGHGHVPKHRQPKHLCAVSQQHL